MTQIISTYISDDHNREGVIRIVAGVPGYRVEFYEEGLSSFKSYDNINAAERDAEAWALGYSAPYGVK